MLLLDCCCVMFLNEGTAFLYTFSLLCHKSNQKTILQLAHHTNLIKRYYLVQK